MATVRVHVYIEGRVQGVFFRANTVKKATSEGVVGWVRNTPDRSVEAVFEGEKDAVEAVVDWCREGPPGSKVRDLNATWEDPTGEFKKFSIKYF